VDPEVADERAPGDVPAWQQVTLRRLEWRGTTGDGGIAMSGHRASPAGVPEPQNPERSNGGQTLLDYFGFTEQPFAATADPAYYYATNAHRECLFHLWNTVDERHGIAVVLGSYGTGKTTLLRKLLTGMRGRSDRYNTAVIASPIPSWTSFSLLESIVTQFGLRPEARSFVGYMEVLYNYLLTKRDRINTLIIDDAQNLNKRGQLELLRLVQNLETPQHKLINLILLAQLEWMHVLRAAPNFEQRVNMTYTLGALNERDTRRLIDFRLRQAGVSVQNPVFDDDAVRVIHSYAEGSPRVTVTLCRNALLMACQLHTRHIGQAIVLHTIQKTTLPDEQKRARVAEQLAAAPQPDRDPGLDTIGSPDTDSPSPRRRVPGLSNVRANRLLLKAARTNPDRVFLTELHDEAS
jgi:general secretion pathway protein A